MLACLDGLIGYVPAGLECLPTLPEGFGSVTESEYGMFVYDKMPTDFFSSYGDSSIWNTMKRMRDDAKSKLMQDIMRNLRSKGEITSHWTGYIGSDAGNSITTTTDYIAQRWDIVTHKRGVLAKVKSVMFWANTSGTKNFRIADRNGAVLHEQEIVFSGSEVQKWVTKELNTTVKIPLWNEDQSTTNYVYFIWDETTTKANKQDCSGCTGVAPVWASYITVSGANMDDWENVSENTIIDTLNGMRVNVTIECGFEELICAAGGDVRVTIAICLQYGWACSLIEWVISTFQINKTTSIGGEFIGTLLEHNQSRYQENLNYLTETLYTGDCIKCDNRISKTKLRK